MTQRFGKYDIHEKLGQGGAGLVQKAWDKSLNRWVALKTLAPGMAQNAELKERFFREAQAAAKLQHPNIVTI